MRTDRWLHYHHRGSEKEGREKGIEEEAGVPASPRPQPERLPSAKTKAATRREIVVTVHVCWLVERDSTARAIGARIRRSIGRRISRRQGGAQGLITLLAPLIQIIGHYGAFQIVFCGV